MLNEAVYLLDLMICRVPGLRAEERIKLQKKFDKEEDFLKNTKKDIENLLERVLEEKSEKSDLRSKPWKMDEIRSWAEKDAALAHKAGIKLLSWREKEYPPLLREIFDPPALLFYRGSLPDPEKPVVAVVGTRKPSAGAAGRAFSLGHELAEAGIPAASGLALGIDSMAHRGNIEGGERTVAVLGSGADNIYPSSNRNLARRILETGGIIFSEYPPGTKPLKWNFPARNRIISGLARGTVIVEAPEKSGALITAAFTLDQGRDLWVDSVGLRSPRGAGTARLAEDGAAVISSAGEILKEWNLTGLKDRLHKEERKTAQSEGAGLASSLAEYLQIKM